MVLTLTANPALDHTVTVEKLELGGTNRVSLSHAAVGGKGINVSRALRQLGVASAATGFLAGPEGRRVEESVAEQGIRPDFIWLKEGSTRVNVKIYEASENRTTELNNPGPIVGQEDAHALLDRLDSLLPQVDFLVCAGSLPQGLPSSFYAAVIEKARVYGVKACLDTSGAALAEGVCAKPYLVKPNKDEAEQLLGYPIVGLQAVRTAVRDLAELGIPVVVLSLGGEGAVFYRTGEDIVWGRAQAEPLRSTTGCGDSLLAGTVAAIKAGLSWEETVRFAVATATAAAELFGTEFPSKTHIEGVLHRVQVQRF